MADTLPQLDPEWVAFEKGMGGPNQLPFDNAQTSRQLFDMMFAGMGSAWPQGHSDIKEQVAQISPEQSIKIYAPAGVSSSQRLPVGLYIHCGGWYAGFVEAEDGLCRDIVRRSKIILFSPHYRLAPEHPWPAGFDDVCAAYEWMHQNAASYGGECRLKVVMGGSAGGNLTQCVGVKYAYQADLRPVALLSGAGAYCDPRSMPEAYKSGLDPPKFADVPMLSQDQMAIARSWLNPPLDEPLHSPLLHPNLGHLPRTYLAVCTNDATYQESIFYYEECKKQGVPVELEEFVGWPHFFWAIPSFQAHGRFPTHLVREVGQVLGRGGC